MFFPPATSFTNFFSTSIVYLGKMRNVMKTRLSIILTAAVLLFQSMPADACTGITLKSKDGSTIVARTIEWGGTYLNSQYVIVPRGYTEQSYTPAGGREGITFTARYGYVGLSVEQKEFVAEGLNEVGLSAGLYYFPHYGKYEEYDASRKERSIADLQLVSLLLATCKTVEDVKDTLQNVHVINIDPRASTVHWRFTDATGKQIVLEIIDGQTRFYDDVLGVLTNSPSFDWQMTNLNNYVNLYPGTTPTHPFGPIELSSFGAGSGFLGLPGDVTPPSRFVRAAFYQTTAPQQDTAEKAAMQGFQILNNFDIPIGIEFATGETPLDIPSATQWTSATDIRNRIVYYRTMYNSTIRRIDLDDIDFSKVKFQTMPLDKEKRQTIVSIHAN